MVIEGIIIGLIVFIICLVWFFSSVLSISSWFKVLCCGLDCMVCIRFRMFDGLILELLVLCLWLWMKFVSWFIICLMLLMGLKVNRFSVCDM